MTTTTRNAATFALADAYDHDMPGFAWLLRYVAGDGICPEHQVPAALVEDPEIAALHESGVALTDEEHTPQTDDGLAGAPPGAASADEEVQGTSGGESNPSSPHDGHTVLIPGPVEVGHWWLREDPPRDPCYCLIGDDHVAEPRFEKES